MTPRQRRIAELIEATTRVDVEADIKAYARRQHQERHRAANKAYRDRHKNPIPVDWTPPPPKPKPDVRDWRVTLDARITRCPGCDDWQWDNKCARCTGREVAA